VSPYTGYVTPVKDQKDCGSCVAFASVATLEICLAKVNAILSDYAEQEFIDCAYDGRLAKGCQGAYGVQTYLSWANRSLAKPNLASETEYPYLNLKPRLTCPKVRTCQRKSFASEVKLFVWV
jgi:Papain family cysteine protease